MFVGPGGAGLTWQPWNQIQFPSYEVPGPNPYSAAAVRALPGVARALSVIGGMLRQMPLNAVRGAEVLARPMILESPDPDHERAVLVGLLADDYLLHGNAVATVTVRKADGWPAAVSYVPAAQVMLEWNHRTNRLEYRIGGRLVPPGDVIHVRRGADPMFPWRGVGVVEQHMEPLGRAMEEGAYSRQVLSGSGVPSVVVIAPNSELSQEEADKAQKSWVDKYAGPVRMPAVLPKGTEVKPLAWSPTDAQLVEARKLTRQDMADIFGLDGYWLGAEASGLTYRSNGPLYLNLMRQTVEPIAQDVEQVLSRALLPHGTAVKFDRSYVLQDDMAGEINMAAKAVDAGLWTWEEARARLGKSPDPKFKPTPAPVALAGAVPVDGKETS